MSFRRKLGQRIVKNMLNLKNSYAYGKVRFGEVRYGAVRCCRVVSGRVWFGLVSCFKLFRKLFKTKGMEW